MFQQDGPHEPDGRLVIGEDAHDRSLGSWVGSRVAGRLAKRRGLLMRIFAGLIFVVAIYMLTRSIGLIG